MWLMNIDLDLSPSRICFLVESQHETLAGLLIQISRINKLIINAIDPRIPTSSTHLKIQFLSGGLIFMSALYNVDSLTDNINI